MKQFQSELQVLNKINVGDTINSGQVFLWEKVGEKWYGINGSDIIRVEENPYKITSFSKKPMDIFRKKDDLKKILQSIKQDRVVKSAVKRSPGLRLMRQDPFQCYISFIVSSNSNIQKIRMMLQLLCKKFGNKVNFDGKEFYAFPEPQQLEKAKIDELLQCGVGYRAKSIKKAAFDVVSGKIDFEFLRKIDYFAAKNYLLEVFGIGHKVADCILLFSLEKLEAFPIDRWMLRVLQKYYSDCFETLNKSLTQKNYEYLHKEVVNHFGQFAGYSQQFLFKMERDLNQKTWL